LDLDPILAGIKGWPAAKGQVYGERAVMLCPLHNISRFVKQRARKAAIIRVKENTETIGRSRPIEVRAVHIDPSDEPGVTLHNKIVH
jgi:hypothetical protein